MIETCNRRRQIAGLAYPRTCAECGLGPCKHSIIDHDNKRKKDVEYVMLADVPAPPPDPDIPLLRAAFRTSVSCGPDGLYEMRFAFPSLEALYKAEDEWRKYWLSKQPTT